tara:strand:+ start:378 stop:1448 length:1071 start_codon:yes stop_codon:yes gene_type:complete
MFQCLDCSFSTKRKYNLQEHYKRKHKKEVNPYDIEKVVVDIEKVVVHGDNIEKIPSKNTKKDYFFEKVDEKNKHVFEISNKFQKNEIILPLTNQNLRCDKCLKEFKSISGYNYHILKCDGSINNLECPYCHKIYASKSTKSKHIKICKVKQAQIMVKEYQTKNNIVNHNITSTTNQQQNIQNIQHIHIYNGKNALEYESDDENYNTRLIHNFGEEITDYINDDELKNMALNINVRKLIELKHFNKEHPENQNIRKNDKKSVKVLRNNEWKVEPKNEIMNQIFNKSKAELYICATDKIFYKELGERETDDKIQQWIEYEKRTKKKLLEYIEIELNEIYKRRRKELGMLENKLLKSIE